jgi:hypothetical protein
LRFHAIHPIPILPKKQHRHPITIRGVFLNAFCTTRPAFDSFKAVTRPSEVKVLGKTTNPARKSQLKIAANTLNNRNSSCDSTIMALYGVKRPDIRIEDIVGLVDHVC